MFFSDSSVIPQRLQRRWWGIILVYITFLAVGYMWLETRTWGYAGRWIWLATAVGTLNLTLLRTHLGDNHRLQESCVLSTLGVGNTITIVRGLCLTLLAGFLFSPQPVGALAWVPVILYTLSDVLDALDGYAARKTNHATRLGETLDVEFDALGLGMISLLAIGYGTLPWWFISLALARYLFMMGLWWRKRQGKPTYSLTVSGYRRLIAGYMMGVMSVSIWPIVPVDGIWLGASVYLAILLTLFGRDWLVASGWLDPTHPTYRSVRHALFTWVNEWLPVGLRVLLALLLFSTGVLSLDLQPHPAWVPLLAQWGFAVSVAPAVAVSLLWATYAWAGCVIAGVYARWLGLAMILPVSVHIGAVGLTWQTGLQLVVVLLLAFTNSGRFSLWRPYEPWVYAPPGTQST